MALSESNKYRQYGAGRGRGKGRHRLKAPPQVLRDLGATRPRQSNTFLRYLLALGIVAALLVPTVALGAGGVMYFQTAASLRPRLDKLTSYHERAFQTSRIFDRNGTLLYEFVNAGRRDPIKIDQVASVLIDATISIEDKTFYENVGVDYIGIIKAGYRNAISGAEVSGASTITQQLIKLVVLSEEERERDNRYRRKLTEVILAQELNGQYSKDQILELYLNEINYGNLAYGIQAAAKGYFGISASELNLNQASLLAGLPQSPTIYNPIQFLEKGKLKGVKLRTGWLNPAARLPHGTTLPRARQVDVLRQMVLNGKITEKEARETIAQDLSFTSQSVSITAPHFVFHVKQALENDPIIGPMLVNEGGLNITTTLDLRVQDLAQREVARRIEELEKEERNIHNGAAVIVQPGTGQIFAMVGSVDYDKTKATDTPGEQGNVLDGNVNVATRDRQPGSALKPFTYLSALVQNKLDAGSVLWDVETRFPIKETSTRKNIDDPELWYGPKNFDLRWHGPLRMRESLANSLNMPAVKALRRAGVKETLDLLHSVGITGLRQPPDYYGLALTLGGGEVTLLDLSTAYNTLANTGEYIPSTPILKITDRAGNELPYRAGERRQAVDPKYVAVVRDFMGDNKAREPIFGVTNTLKLSRPAHVKTGTTEDFRDAWAVGYTPYVTVGVWTGNNNNEKTAKVESTTGGGVIWNRIMEGIFKDPTLERLFRGQDLSVPLEFPSPTTYGVEERKVCQLGGKFGQRTKEWSIPGQVLQSDTNGLTPTAGRRNQTDCDLYKTVQVVLDPNGRLCTPVKGVNYGSRLRTMRVWSLPPSSDEEVVIEPRWDTGTLANSPIMVAPERVCGANVANAPPLSRDVAQALATSQSLPPSAQNSGATSAQTGRTTTARQGAQQPAPTAAVQQQPAAPVSRATVAPAPAVQPAPATRVPVAAPPPTRVPVAAPPPTQVPVAAPPPTRVPVAAPPPTRVPAAPPTQAPPPTAAPPPPTEAPAAPVAVIPNMVGLGENQARAVLANLGITSVVVDYQGPDRLGALFEQYPPYAVVSHDPGPGVPVTPGMTVVLGVRAP